MNNERPGRALGLGLAHTLTLIARANGVAEEICLTVAKAARALAAATEAGHVCISLATLGNNPSELRHRLLTSGLAMEAGAKCALPLVLDGADRLYLYRYFDYESRLVAALDRLARQNFAPPDLKRLKTMLDTLFAANAARLDPGEPDRQKIAAALAVLRPLTIISGGPGTGKTTTVVAILACLLAEQPGLRIVLAAPTGKAAVRMRDAMRKSATSMDLALQAQLPDRSHTIHRLLEVIPDSGRFRHNRSHPLALDVLVVDEASMLDLAMACKLLEALPRHARLILLGDKDQLAAVEAGAVFQALSANSSLSAPVAKQIAAACGVTVAQLLTGTKPRSGRLIDTTVWFTRNFRFDRASPIGILAGAIRDGDINLAVRALSAKHEDADAVVWRECLPGPLPPNFLDRIAAGYQNYLGALLGATPNAREALEAFEQHRVLCALRQGPRGVTQLNIELTKRITHGLGLTYQPGNPWYAGRPIIITENDHALRLYNGDVGISLPGEDGRLLVWFSGQDLQMRAIAASRLPAHETAFATTVHKAQGSEFAQISLVLPSQESPVLTRELVYTAITRARNQVTGYGELALLTKGMSNTTQRDSGLAGLLDAQG